MPYLKLVVDGKNIAAFKERYEIGKPPYPKYIIDLINKNLSGIVVEKATKQEFLRYKQTRRKKAPPPEERRLF